MIEINLPMPPSTNGLWVNVPGRGRVRSRIYKKWATEAGWELQLQRPKKIKGNYSLTILLSKLRRGSDVANREKALSDLLQTHGIIENDSLLQDLHMKWDDQVKSGWVKLILEPV